MLIHEIANEDGRLSREASLSIFRIYQEALNNIVRHSGAAQATVHFSLGEETAVLEVADNGSGMDVLPDLTTQAGQSYYGLAGMKERAEAVGGRLHLSSTPGRGTIVTVRVPLEKIPKHPDRVPARKALES